MKERLNVILNSKHLVYSIFLKAHAKVPVFTEGDFRYHRCAFPFFTLTTLGSDSCAILYFADIYDINELIFFIFNCDKI